MKKVLYGTTALVAGVAFAGAAYAAPIELSIGGKQEVFFGFGGIDDDGSGNSWSNTGMTTDTELYFTGSTTLDNGITVNAIIQLEAEDNNDRNADEQAIQFTGGFGTLQLGQRQSLAGALGYNAPSAGGVIGFDEYRYGFVGGMNSTLENYYTADDLGVSYATPSFFGFTAAVGYAPESANGDDGGFHQYRDGSFTDIITAGLAYDGEFSGVGLHGDFVYSRMDGVGNGPRTSTPTFSSTGVAVVRARTTGATADQELFRGGLAVDYMGFEVGGSYGYWDVDGPANDAQIWTVGASYQNGPYGVAFNFYNNWQDNVSDMWGIQFSGNYILAPGINLGAAIFHADENAAGTAGGGDNDSVATGGMMGVGLSF